MTKSKIEWTERTWNPVVGCGPVSPGCTNCYAMKMAARIERMGTAPHYAGLTQASKAGAVWTGKTALAPDSILQAPLRRKKPTMYFVNSMGDLFHPSVPDRWIDEVFAVMALCPQHTFQVLTKQSARMQDYMSKTGGMGTIAAQTRIGHHITDIGMADIEDHGHLMSAFGNEEEPNIILDVWPLPNVWLGVSAEDQTRADQRIPDLLNTPAAIRFVSYEPALGPIDFGAYLSGCWECAISCGHRTDEMPVEERCVECGEECGPDTDPVQSEGCPKCDGELEPICPECNGHMVTHHPDTPCLDWIICGGESGPNARPMHPDWARSVRDQCAAAGTAFFFKQWGEWGPRTRHLPSGTPGRYAIADASGQWVTKVNHYPRQFDLFGGSKVIERVGKKRAGRLLDGVEHNGMPGALT